MRGSMHLESTVENMFPYVSLVSQMKSKIELAGLPGACRVLGWDSPAPPGGECMYVATTVGLEGLSLGQVSLCHPHHRREHLTLQLTAPCTSSSGLVCVSLRHLVFLAEELVPGAGHQEEASGRTCRLHCPSPLSTGICPHLASGEGSIPERGFWAGDLRIDLCDIPGLQRHPQMLCPPEICEEQEEERELPKARTRVRDPGEAESLEREESVALGRARAKSLWPKGLLSHAA